MQPIIPETGAVFIIWTWLLTCLNCHVKCRRANSYRIKMWCWPGRKVADMFQGTCFFVSFSGWVKSFFLMIWSTILIFYTTWSWDCNWMPKNITWIVSFIFLPLHVNLLSSISHLTFYWFAELFMFSPEFLWQ